MLVEFVKERLLAAIEELQGRAHEVADLSELLRKKALPNAPAVAYVLPLGLSGRGGESSAGAFTQMVDEIIGVVLVIRTANDVTGGRGVPKLDNLIWRVIEAVCGSAEAGAIGDFRLMRGRMVTVVDGSIFYQLDFATQLQVRITS
ncbi:phage tail terminator protein [Paradevosia shaoguanensis]|uniref:Uncharacterized protein n=1 Tax=Paradevosia shaoguanensis TaxID=1335043 RepID=A0AA41QQE3_9HYPH|nr:hypothetical protein [Paradevosia shaoguanensis]MCF1744622.1 hypothetical protein [Paradevosia shaoguanensis]MCI0129105.1 hypothetical protein [Paradevosia shaoguanensis]